MNNVRILLVDDDESDIILFQRLCQRAELKRPITVASDAAEALKILKGHAEALAPPGSYIVVTDINMPGMSGHDLIRAIRDDPALHQLVVFVVSTSDLEKDIQLAFDQNVAGYIVKDDEGVRLWAAVKMLRNLCDASVFAPISSAASSP